MEDKLCYCQACLSSDRTLYPLSKLEDVLQRNSLWELLSIQGGVCWECNHIIRKFSIFRHQIQQAQQLLQDFKIQHLTSLSKLAIKPIFDNQINISHDPLENQETNNQTDTNQGNMYIEINIPDEVQKVVDGDEKEIKIKDEIDVEIQSPIDYSECRGWSADTSEIKSEIQVDIAKPKVTYKLKYKKQNIKKIKRKSRKDPENGLMDKFTMVVFTEEEMIRIREEKKNHPNFKKIPYKCDSCVLGFVREDTYNIHMEKKHDENIGPFTCPVCHIRFTCEKQVGKHKSKHYVCYRCKLCKYETLEMWSALSHCRTKHGKDDIENIHCGFCDFVGKSPEELSQHRSIHPVFCNECGAKFKALNTLKSHIRRIHEVKREFVCDICSKTFMTKTRLESHMVTHNATIAQKLAYCGACKVQYKNIYVYRNHLKTSANHAEQSYQCVECNKRFASKVYWKKHYNFYHLHKSQFRCDVCNKLFISDWRLKSHMQTQHGLSRSRDHHCTICGKQFFTLSTLKGHQLTHSEQRSFMCEDCGDTFKQRPALYTHYKLVHRGVKRRNKHALTT